MVYSSDDFIKFTYSKISKYAKYHQNSYTKSLTLLDFV